MADSPAAVPGPSSSSIMTYVPSMIKKMLDKVSVSAYCSLLCSDRFAPLISCQSVLYQNHWALETDRYGKPMLVDINNFEEHPITIDEPVELTENVTRGL